VTDWRRPLNWEYLVTAPAEDVARLNEWYLAYYCLTGNYVVGVGALVAGHLIGLLWLPFWGRWLLILAFVIFLLNTITQREELAVLMGTGLPHDGVYTRIKPSRVASGGVGVFAICDIKQGTYLFEPDDEKVVWIPASRVNELPKQIRKLYYDFGPLKKGKYYVPTSLNKLTVAWYLNEPAEGETPNVGCDADLKFYALTDIKEGDELTVDYSGYSDPPPEE
jgi:hypothetical protein